MEIIYALVCPIAKKVRYIGKTSNQEARYRNHCAGSRKPTTHRHRWLNKVKDAGLKPRMKVLCKVGDGEGWQEIEKRWIAAALERGWPLTNESAGGDGCEPLEGEHKERRRKKWASPEMRRKMSEAAKARWADPEKREKGLRGLQSEERRRIGSEKAKARATPEYRAMMSAKTKAMWADPEKRGRILAGITDQTRSAVSKAAKRMWETTEHREKMLANLKARG